MEREQVIREAAAKHLGVETLETRNSDALDFYSVAVWSIRSALEATYEAGKALTAGEVETPAERSGHWQTMTVDQAIEHLETWIDMIDDPSQIAALMIHVCGCPRAAVINGTHIAAELP